MNVLLLGSGGREHALAWKLNQSTNLEQLYIAPGNAGTEQLGTNLPLDIGDTEALASTVRKLEIGLVVVGPEAPLVNGVVDFLAEKFPLLPVVGPKASGAQLEGSKSFSKDFMARHGIPTASYQEFSKGQQAEGIAYLRTLPLPIVLKADGLAAGKGVLICQSHEEAIREFQEMINGKFGSAGDTVVVEEFLDGIEFSIFVLTDGKNYLLLPEAKDYKRIGEGDTGLNTGGMGSISPVPFVDEELLAKVHDQIIKPTIRGIADDGMEYKGFIFFGLIKVGDQPMVIEYNCRMGDPETQSVIPRLNNDLVELCLATAHGTLDHHQANIDPRSVASVVMVSGGYPGSYEKGKTISGLTNHKDGVIFHAGTTSKDDEVLTNGGRVLAISSYGPNHQEAVKSSMKKAEKIHFEGAYYRSDIGFDLE